MEITAKAIKIIENRVTVAREFAKPENSEGLFLAEAYEAGRAALEGVDETQESVDAALERLKEMNGSDDQMTSTDLQMVADQKDGPDSDDLLETDAMPPDAMVPADVLPEANDMMIA